MLWYAVILHKGEVVHSYAAKGTTTFAMLIEIINSQEERESFLQLLAKDDYELSITRESF